MVSEFDLHHVTGRPLRDFSRDIVVARCDDSPLRLKWYSAVHSQRFTFTMNDTNCLCLSRECSNSSLFHFNSGHEASQRVSNGTANIFHNTAFSFPEKEPKISPSPKSGRRTRKLSLFSFHLNSKEKEDKGKTRRNSQPASTYTNQPSPSSLSPPMLDFLPTMDKTDSNSSLSSFASSTSNSRKCSSVLGVVERENLAIQDIIEETLKLQFDNVTEYKRELCDRLAKNVSQLVKRRVEVLKEAARLPCKIVSLVYVAAIRDHGIEFVSQASLESDKDNFIVASYRNGRVFAVGGVMVIPLEK